MLPRRNPIRSKECGDKPGTPRGLCQEYTSSQQAMQARQHRLAVYNVAPTAKFYQDKEQLSQHRVRLDSPSLCFLNQQPLDGLYIYVMAPDGRLYASQVGMTREIKNHDYFLSGQDVRCAGMFYCEQGKMKLLNNNSGHYKPSYQDLACAVYLLHHANMTICEDLLVEDHSASTAGHPIMTTYKASDVIDVFNHFDAINPKPEPTFHFLWDAKLSQLMQRQNLQPKMLARAVGARYIGDVSRSARFFSSHTQPQSSQSDEPIVYDEFAVIDDELLLIDSQNP